MKDGQGVKKYVICHIGGSGKVLMSYEQALSNLEPLINQFGADSHWIELHEERDENYRLSNLALITKGKIKYGANYLQRGSMVSLEELRDR